MTIIGGEDSYFTDGNQVIFEDIAFLDIITNREEEMSGFILGDADLNGKVNIKDATLIQKHIAKLAEITAGNIVACDVNADEIVNIKDATAIQKFVAKIETGYPIGEPVN